MATLTALLTETKAVSPEKIRDAMERQVVSGKNLEVILLEMAAIDEDRLTALRAQVYGHEPVAAEHVMNVDEAVLRTVPKVIAQHYRIVPVEHDDDALVVAALKPVQDDADTPIGFLLGHRLETCITNEARMAGALAKHYGVPLPDVYAVALNSEKRASKARMVASEKSAAGFAMVPDDQAVAAIEQSGSSSAEARSEVPDSVVDGTHNQTAFFHGVDDGATPDANGARFGMSAAGLGLSSLGPSKTQTDESTHVDENELRRFGDSADLEPTLPQPTTLPAPEDFQSVLPLITNTRASSKVNVSPVAISGIGKKPAPASTSFAERLAAGRTGVSSVPLTSRKHTPFLFRISSEPLKNEERNKASELTHGPVVDVDLEGLAARVATATEETADELIAALLPHNPKRYLPLLAEHFPGTLWVNDGEQARRLKDSGAVAEIDLATTALHPAELSGVMRAFVRTGEKAVAQVALLLGDPRPIVRYFATYLAADLRYPGLIEGLGQRIFDADKQVRELAVHVMRRFHHLENDYERIMEGLRSVATGEEYFVDARMVATDALGKLRDPGALEILIALLDGDNETLRSQAEASLIRLTLQDFGASQRRWLDWARANRNTQPDEWVIDALTSTKKRIRELAHDELIRLCPEDFGYHANLSQADRKRAQSKILTWWQDQNSAR